VAVSDKILFAEKTCRNGAEEPALNFRFARESDRLLRCHELTRRAIGDQMRRSKTGKLLDRMCAAASLCLRQRT
jgi:hypothetical protein